MLYNMSDQKNNSVLMYSDNLLATNGLGCYVQKQETNIVISKYSN